jgi:Amt family ammonium transporter
VLAAPAYAFTATFVILRVIGLFTRLRVTEREEAIGMDVIQHGEEAYTTGEGAILVGPEDGFEAEAGRRFGERIFGPVSKSS